MNLSLLAEGGEVLVLSQVTLCRLGEKVIARLLQTRQRRLMPRNFTVISQSGSGMPESQFPPVSSKPE